MAQPPVPARIGRYEVIDRIGRGGMAEVFLARAVGPGGIAKRLCIKRMLPDLLLTPRALERFTEEARMVLALQHANIVPVFDFGRDGQDLFLAMEWIDGCDLGALLAAAPGSPLPAPVAGHVAIEVARALAYAHAPATGRAGLLHADVTPRNVLLSRQGEVRLTDFGIARAVGGGMARAGTPAYMAPEAARGEPVDARADLYCLGLVFAELLSGRRLRTDNDLAAACLPVRPPALEGVPAPFAEVARRLLAAEPAARFASATEVVNALAAPLAAELVRGGEAPAPLLAALVARAAPAGARTESPGPLTEASTTVDLPVAPAPARRRRGGLLAASALLVAVAAVLGVRVASRPRPAVQRAPAPAAAPAAPKPRPVSPAPTPPERPPTARLRILTPGSWVDVFLDGARLGEGPGQFTIPAGKHQLRVQNVAVGFSRTEVITAAPGATVDLVFQTRQ
jgi:tRNA A-37 threonylcarbamoyl transferase component Bud32